MVILSINSHTAPGLLHHEIGHMLQSKRRYLFWHETLLPTVACAGINIFLENQLPHLVWARLGVIPVFDKLYKTIRSRNIEREADDLVPNQDNLLSSYKEYYQGMLEERKQDYLSSINEGSMSKRIGKTFLKTLFPESVGFPIFEALFIDQKHPGMQYSIDRLQKRIDGTLDTTPKAPKPPLLDNASFRVAETTGITYGLAAYALYTFTGPEKTLQLMTPLTEKLVSSLTSKAFDAIENKVSKKISSIFNKPA